MTNENNPDDLKSPLSNKLTHDFLNDRSWMPAFAQYELGMNDICNDFILNFLARKRTGKGKIDSLLLRKNKVPLSLKMLWEKQSLTEYGYAEIIKQTDKYVELKITLEGIKHYRNISKKYKIRSVTQIERIIRYVLKLIRQFWSLVFVSANNRIKTMMESGIIKLILFIMAVLSFILKDEIKAWFLEWWNK